MPLVHIPIKSFSHLFSDYLHEVITYATISSLHASVETWMQICATAASHCNSRSASTEHSNTQTPSNEALCHKIIKNNPLNKASPALMIIT